MSVEEAVSGLVARLVTGKGDVVDGCLALALTSGISAISNAVAYTAVGAVGRLGGITNRFPHWKYWSMYTFKRATWQDCSEAMLAALREEGLEGFLVGGTIWIWTAGSLAMDLLGAPLYIAKSIFTAGLALREAWRNSRWGGGGRHKLKDIGDYDVPPTASDYAWNVNSESRPDDDDDDNEGFD